MKKLNLEFRNEFIPTITSHVVGNITMIITPPIDKDYWVFRVKVHKDQSIVAFPKFGTMGIGFTVESDWNTNFPYTKNATDIYNHIERNKKYDSIMKETCIEAIEILQRACKYYKENELVEEKINNEPIYFENYLKKMHKIVGNLK